MAQRGRERAPSTTSLADIRRRSVLPRRPRANMRVLTIGPGRSYRPGKGQIALAHRLYLLLIHNEGAVRIGDAIARQWLERRRGGPGRTRRPSALPGLLFWVKAHA